MLHVAPDWIIPSEDIELRFVKSSGPGGQNVNKLASKVELRFRMEASAALSPGQKRRLRAAFPGHTTKEGELVISGDRFRTQRANQRDVEARLVQMLLAIRFAPKRRVATRPSRAVKKRRVADKRARGEVKRQRRGDGY